MNSKWLSTNDLRIFDINKLETYKNIKPRKNPIHFNFVDELVDVFNKFNFEENDFYGKGGFNKVYKNKRFILRISRKILNINSELENIYLEDLKDFDEKNKYINVETQKLSEQILIKAFKNSLSPKVYYFGNININGFIHRYILMEACTMSLDVFFKNYEYLHIQDKYGYYKDYGDLMECIGNQLTEIFEKLVQINYVYYDIKPENIVVNVDSISGKIDLKLIDWDCEYLDEYEWINNYENKDCIIFLNLLIISYFVNIFYKKKFLKNILKKLYNNQIIENLFKILNDLPKYVSVLKHYFLEQIEKRNKSNENQENQENHENDENNKNENQENIDDSIKNLIIRMLNRCL